MKAARPFIVVAILLALMLLSTIAEAAAPARGSSPAHALTPTPPPTGTPTPPGGSVISSITQTFHHLEVPAETISEVLAGIFNKAAEKEVGAMSEEVARWTQVIGEIVQAPSTGDYGKVAQSSLPVAAALAPALFLLRLALYHGGRLLGDDDSGLRVIGNWVTAGALAVASGPFLDLIIRLGWWMVGKVIGETGGLAVSFVKSTTATSALLGIGNLTFLGSLLSISLALGSLLAIGGMLFAFASANAVLFILAVLAPPLAIASVLPQARWLRSLWLKAVLLIAMLPVVAGGVFKAGLASRTWLGQQGLLSAILRVIWLWGATGLLLAVAGILGRMTIMTSADAVGQMMQAAKQIVSIGALAASGIGVAGAGRTAATGATAGARGTTATAAGGTAASSSLSNGQAALGHLGAAQQLTHQAAAYEGMGLHIPATYNRSLAHSHEIAARQADLSERMQRFGSTEMPSSDFGFSPTVNTAIRSNFNGSVDDFRQGFEALSSHISEHRLDPNSLAAQYPEDTSRMVQTYLEHPDDINRARDPLHRAAELGGARQLQHMLTFRPASREVEET